jgi:predicted outer membrane repeat protein
LTIDGSGQSITIDGANSFSIFNAQTGVTLNLEFLTLAHGSADEGGAIFNQGTTTVTNCTFSGNTAIAGGAIFTNGAMMITNSTFSSNQAAGGGAIELNNPSNVTITNSTFSDNQSGPRGPFEGPGGAIANDGGKLSVTNSTFFDNQAFGGEGASGLGGAIFNTLDTETIPFTPATLTVTNSRFSGNKAEVSSPNGGAIANFESTASLKGNILASSTPNNCNAAVTDAGYNISDDGSCGFTGTSIDNSTTLHLDPAGLRNNGGPTNTIALEPNSQAVDFIPVAECTDQSTPTPLPLTTDQRGFPRPDPGNPNFCDVGAFELQTMPVVISSNGERVQIARSTTPNSDQVNIAFTFTEIGSPTCDAADDAFNGFTVFLRPGSCGAFVDDVELELLLNPWVVHTVNHQSYGTHFGSNPPATLSARMVQLPTPAAPACGEWTVNIELAGVDTSGLGNGPFALILSNPDGNTGCLDVPNAIVGNQIDPPTRTVRRGVRR